MSNLVRTATLTGFATVAQSLGLDVRGLLREVGLDRCDLSDPDVLIPAEAVRELLERSARAAKVEDFGLRLSAQRNLAHLGPIGLVVREEPNVRSAVATLERYFRLYSGTLVISLEEANELAILRAQLTAFAGGAVRQTVELTIGAMVRTLRALIGEAWTPELVCFSHPAPTRRTLHRAFFWTRVLFDHEFSGIVFPARDLEAPIPAADPVMARYVRHYLDAVAGHPAGTMSARVRQVVYALLPSGRCSGATVARQLGIDRRTVSRKLAATGDTFSSILDGVRIELTRRHIETERRSLTDTAQLLGFSSLSTFSRWFHGQFGCSASAWRKGSAASLGPIVETGIKSRRQAALRGRAQPGAEVEKRRSRRG